MTFRECPAPDCKYNVSRRGMTYNKYNVTRAMAYCPNCGTKKPYSHRFFINNWDITTPVLVGALGAVLGLVFAFYKAQYGMYAFENIGKVTISAAVLFGILGGLIIGGVAASEAGYDSSKPVAFAVGAGVGGVCSGLIGAGLVFVGSTWWILGPLAGLLAGGLLGGLIGIHHDRKRDLCLNETGQRIHDRIGELEQKFKRIQTNLARLESEPDSTGLEHAKAVLEQSKNQGQLAYVRYQAKLREVELIRWQNQLQPDLETWLKTNSYEVREKAIDKELGRAVQSGEAKVKAWKEAWLRFDQAGKSPDWERTYSKLVGTVEHLHSVRRELIGRQALGIAEGSSPIDEATQGTPIIAGGVGQQEFDHQVDLQGFLSAFHQLEAEHVRILNEQLAIEEVEKL